MGEGHRDFHWFVHFLLLLTALLCELAALAVALTWIHGDFRALIVGGLAAFFGSVFLDAAR